MRPLAVGKKKPGLDRVLGRRDLVLLFVVAVANLNLIPAISSSGPVTLWLWLLALACFFWPQGAAVTELAQKWPGEGGIYLWAKRSFGEEHGFLAGWCYWLSNVVYLPTVVLSCVGVAVYVAGPKIQKLADSHAFTGIASLLIILFLLALNVRGLSSGQMDQQSRRPRHHWRRGHHLPAGWADFVPQRKRAPSCRSANQFS